VELDEPVLAVADALPAPSCPVTWTSFPTKVRRLSRLPVSLYVVRVLSVRAKVPVIGDPERQPVNPLPLAAGAAVLGVVELPGAD